MAPIEKHMGVDGREDKRGVKDGMKAIAVCQILK